jgi:hypothetical protein
MIATLEGNAERIGCPLVEGATYRYTSGFPVGCRGRKYCLHREVVDVPSYQRKVLVEALDGPDRGLWFTCTLQNFALRYEMVGQG